MPIKLRRITRWINLNEAGPKLPIAEDHGAALRSVNGTLAASARYRLYRWTGLRDKVDFRYVCANDCFRIFLISTVNELP